MGIIISKEKRLSKSIDQNLKAYKHETSRTIRILLLGSGQAGKSTILKQMRIFNNHGFTFEEREYYTIIIRDNISSYIHTLLSAMKTFGITFNDHTLQTEADRLLDNVQHGNDLEFTPECVLSIKTLWNNPAMSYCYKMRNKFQLPDCAKYFLDSIDRITDAEYVPSDQDMLYARIPTTGVVETTFNSGKHESRVFDVGGQRSERRKWIHVFDNVTTMIFLTAISDYDLVLDEDRTKNRIHDSMELYEAFTNSDFFINKDIILFLNKIDLFKEKLATVPLTLAFPMYTGLQSYETGIFFMRHNFEKRNTRNKERKIKVHETCATDTTQVKVVINTVILNVMNYNRMTSGFV